MTLRRDCTGPFVLIRLEWVEGKAVGTIPVFASYDLEHDRLLYERLERESSRAGASFSIVSSSERYAPSTDWECRTKELLSAVKQVIFLCGEHTDEAQGVAEELRLVRSMGKPYLLLWGARDLACKKPSGAKADEGMYRWSAPILREQMSQLARSRDWERAANALKRPGRT